MHATAGTRPILVQQLQELGVRAGGLLMVHASLRSVGPVEGGASGLLDALIDFAIAWMEKHLG